MPSPRLIREEKRCPCGQRALILCIDCQGLLCDQCYDLGEGRCAVCARAPESWTESSAPQTDTSRHGN
jgi:hypothetical protein